MKIALVVAVVAILAYVTHYLERRDTIANQRRNSRLHDENGDD